MKSFPSLVSLIVASLAFSACATDVPPATALADGALTPAPAGWTRYCERHPEDPGCRP